MDALQVCEIHSQEAFPRAFQVHRFDQATCCKFSVLAALVEGRTQLVVLNGDDDETPDHEGQ